MSQRLGRSNFSKNHPSYYSSEMTGSSGQRRARDGGGAYGGTGPDQRRDNGSGRDDYRYGNAAAGGGGSRPPHEYDRGGPGRNSGGFAAAIPSAHAQPHWERDRSRERGDTGMGGSGWDQRDRDRYRGAGGGGSEFGSDPLAMQMASRGGGGSAASGMTRAGTVAGAGGNINSGPVDAFGRALQPSMLGRSQTDSGTYGGGGASTASASASTSKASVGRSSSASDAVSHTKEYLQNIGGKAGTKQGGSTIGGRNFPWQRGAGASSSSANRPPTPPLPPGGKLPPPRSKAAATAAAAAVRPHHSSSQQQASNSKDYNDYLRSVQKRSSHNVGGGGAGRKTQLGRVAAQSAATVDRLKAISAGNPKASAATAVAAVSSTATTDGSMAAKPPVDVGGASAKNAPLPDKKAASVARKRHPTRNELLQSVKKPFKNNLASRVGTKAKHPPPSGSGAVSPTRGNRLLLAKVDKPTKKTMARKVQGATTAGGGQTSTSGTSGSPRGETETQKQPVQQMASNKPSAKRVGRAAAAMSKENHAMPHQHDGPVEVCAVGKQHTGRIIPTVSTAPKFVSDATVKLPGEGKGGKAAKPKPKSSTGKAKAKVAKATNKVAAKMKELKDGIARKTKAFSHPQVTAASAAKSSSATSDGSPSPRGEVPIPSNSASHSTPRKEENDPSKSGVSAPGGTDKSSYSSMEEAQARLVAKKKPQLVLEGKIQESGTISTLPKAPSDDLPATASTKGSADAQQAPSKPSIGIGASAARTKPTGETSDGTKRTYVEHAGPNDVFCGSGSHFAINSLEGNQKYRALIQEHKEEYLKADDAEREKLAHSIVAIIHRRDGRFLEKVGGYDSQFCIIDDDKALGETMINFYGATTTSQDKAIVTDGKKKDGSTVEIGESHTDCAAKLPSSKPSGPSKDVDGEEKKDDEPDGGSVDGPTKSKKSEEEDVEAPEVVLVNQAIKKCEISETKFVTKDDSDDVIDIDGDSTNGSDDGDVICIDDSPDQDEKVSTEERSQKKKANTDNNSIISIGSSSSSSSSSGSNAPSAVDSEVEIVGVKKNEGEVRVKSTKAWVCDVCNIAEFTDEEDAIAHENICTCRPSIPDANGTADTGNTTLNASDAVAQTDVSAPPEALARAQGTTNEKDDEYDSSDDERSLEMKPIEYAALESSQSSSEGGSKSDIPTTIEVKALSTPKSSDKAMQDSPMKHAPNESDEEDDIPAHKNTSPPRLSTKAKASPLKERYVGSSERLAMKASIQANSDASKKRTLDQSKAVGLDYPKEKKKKHRHVSSSSGGKKKALAKGSPLTPLTLGRGPNELIMMEAVPHLTRTELDNVTGKPVHFITVYSSTMDILYDFKVTIRQSQIENSGHGAFLTYLGARLLNEERRGRTWDVLDNCSGRPPDASLKPLEATFRRTNPIFPDSHRATVKLKGENLDEYGGEEYWADTQNDLFAVMSGSKNKIKIKLTDNNNELHDNGQDLLASRNLHPGEIPIGFRHLHRESHYEKVSIPFCSYFVGCGLIDLGRYGPFRRSDRKTELEFGIKDFVFEHEPSGWMFGVDEKLRGEDQAIDITDDRTGETHMEAQEHIPMYVNEVGYNKKLVQNVLPREITGREVHYFLHFKDPIYKGQEVELLTDYLKPYEPMRERKGYGKANINKGVKSDYDCTKTRTLRNLCERYFMDDTIESLNSQEVIHSLRFIDQNILRPVVTSTEWYIDKARKADDYVNSHNGIGQRIPKTQPPSRQWIARRRMHWFHGRYRDKIMELKRNNEMSETDAEEADAIVERMRWTDLSTIFPFMNEIKLWSGKRLGKSLLLELQEELYYMASKDVCGLFEASLWCHCAESLANEISFVLACVPLATKAPSIGSDLSTKVMQQVEKTGSFIKKLCEALSEKETTLEKREKMCKLLELQSKPRATGNGKQSPSFDRLHRIFEIDIGKVGEKTKSVIIATPSLNDNGNRTPHAVPAVTAATANQVKAADQSVPNIVSSDTPATDSVRTNLRQKLEARDASEFPDGNVSPNVTWYLQFQLVYVIDSLARSFDEIWSRDFGEKLNWYSLETICNRLDLDYDQTKALIEHTRAKASTIAQFTTQTVADDDDDDEMDGSDYKTPKKRSQRKPKKGNTRSPLSVSTAGSQRPKNNKKLFNATIWKTLEDDLGWRVEIKGQDRGRNDCYFFPPGTHWGSKKRCEFFDSVPLVVEFIKTDPKWKDNLLVKAAIDRYYCSMEYVDTLRRQKKLPKMCDAEWLLKHMDEHSDKKPPPPAN